MRFYVLSIFSRVPMGGHNVGYLQTDNWNDWWIYRTLYRLTYFDIAGRRHDIGEIKIGQFEWQKDQDRPQIPNEFERLDQPFFSLGQDTSYYTTISQLPNEEAEELLSALHDLVADRALFARARNENVTGVSLLRSVSVKAVTEQFLRILNGGAVLTDYSFRYNGPTPQDNDIDRLRLEFKVVPNSAPPSNIHVLIGRNGVGKTHLLSGMTRALLAPSIDPENDGTFTSVEGNFEEISPFAGIVSVTFSAFDEFTRVPECPP